MTGRNKNLINFANKLPTTFSGSPVLPHNFATRLNSLEELDDFEFDQILPARYRFVAEFHWTPIQVARMIAAQIGADSTQNFVDIGSGVGKLCILLSFLTKMEIFGIEQRKHLHEIAETIVRANGITRVKLSHCNMMDIEWEKFDVFFFFNPFQEHMLKSEIFAIDENINREPDLYAKYISFVEDKIENLAVGKRLITLEGFGGTVSENWRLVSSEELVDGKLNHWIKES